MKKKIASLALLAAPMILLAGCSKPDEGKVHDKLVKEGASEGLNPDQATKFADCAAPKLHDKLSASSLDTFVKDGIGSKIKKEDADTGSKIIEDCAKSLTK